MSTTSLSVRQNMLWNTIGCLIYQACLWLMTITVVLVSGNYANSGILAFAMSIGNIYYPFATYNMRTIQISDLTSEISSSEYIAFRYVTVGFAFIPIVIYIMLSTSDLSLMFSTILWLLFKADEAFCAVFYGMEQKAERMDFIGISQAVRGIGGLLFFSAPLYFGLSINVAFISLSLFCITVTWLYDARHASFFGSVIPKIQITLVFRLIKQYLPVVLTAVFFGAVVSVSRQQLAQIGGTEELGVYAAVATPTVLVQAAASFLYGPLMVGFAEKWHEHNHKEFIVEYLRVAAFIVMFTMLISLACSLFGDKMLLLLFGSSISRGVSYLVPAVIATGLTTLFAFSYDLLVVIRETWGAFLSTTAALLCSYLISSFFIHHFGSNGVSYAVSTSFILGLVLAIVFFVRRLNTINRFISQPNKLSR